MIAAAAVGFSMRELRVPIARRGLGTRSLRAVVGVIGCAVVAGCAGEDDRNAFDEISRLPETEVLIEVPIGRFVIPVPVVLDDDADEIRAENLLQLTFELVAIVAPRHESLVKRLGERHEGRIRDKVIGVCRNTARDDLLESEWATLKAHLLDAMQPLLGGTIVRRLATPHKLIEPL